MARRKRDIIEDESSDSDGSGDGDPGERHADLDPDERAEHDLHNDPYQRKRRRRGGKEEALYGIFGEEDDYQESNSRNAKSSKARVDWTKAPAFVTGDVPKVDISKELEDDHQSTSNSDGEGEEDEVDDDSTESSVSRPPSPRVRDDEEEDQVPTRTGFGFAKSTTFTNQPSTDGPPAVAEEPGRSEASYGVRAGIGGRRGIGSSKPPATDLPTAFGTQTASGARNQRSFLRETPTVKPSPKLSAEEARHFSSLKSTFGARMLEKMGWQTGLGLGASNEGIVTPIESKLRPQKMGLGHGGFKERTDQARTEARRRGELLSDDDEESMKSRIKKGKGKGKAGHDDGAAGEKKDQWKRPRKSKTIVHHRTYEEIMADAGLDATPATTGIGVIIDATGATPREVSSLSQVSVSPWGATNEPERLPELRHNLRLLVDLSKGDLDGLAKEAKALEERKKWVNDEDGRLRKAVVDEAEMISRLQNVHLVVDDINTKAKEIASSHEPSLEPFTPLFQNLMFNYASEVEDYNMDEIFVAAITPVIGRMLSTWNPLVEPGFLASQLKAWRVVLKISKVEEPKDQVGLYNALPIFSRNPPKVEAKMTPYESLLWNVWLPKVRSCINNEWSPSQPQPMIDFLTAWFDVVPPFIRDNILDQLLLPKVQRAVSEWTPRKDAAALHSLVFPWLPHVGLRMEQFVGDARRKVKSLFRSWKADDGVPHDLMVWKEVFEPSDWQHMLLKHIVPKLSAVLRDEFKINPRNQDMEPFNWVMQWSGHIKDSVFAQILETDFFPKWLNILHIWLVQPNVSYDQVTQWYTFWKKSVPDKVYALPPVTHGFKAGLELMNEALSLGPDTKGLPKPQFRPLSSTPSTGSLPKPVRPLAGVPEVTFRSIVEEFASSHNLLFIPSGKTHEKSRLPLFKVSKNIDGRGGILVYLQDDAVWTEGEAGGEYQAVGLEDMVLRATRATK